MAEHIISEIESILGCQMTHKSPVLGCSCEQPISEGHLNRNIS